MLNGHIFTFIPSIDSLVNCRKHILKLVKVTQVTVNITITIYVFAGTTTVNALDNI